MTTSVMTETVAGTEDEVSLVREIRRWIFALDPAILARRHLLLTGLWLVLGLLSALFLRMELLTPALDTMQARTFGALLSLHGFLMFYFVALPVFPGVVGHLLLARWRPEGRLLFPRLGALSWHLLAVGGLLVSFSFLVGGTEIGWSFDAGFSGRFTQPGTIPVALGVLMAGLSVAVMSVQLLASLRTAREATRGEPASRFLLEALGASSVMGLVVGPLLVTAMILVLADAVFGWSVFAKEVGGNPQLFVLLFRFFNGPAQTMLLLGALGVSFFIIAERVRGAVFHRGHFTLFILFPVLSFGGWGAEIGAATSGQPIPVLSATSLSLGQFAVFLFGLLFVLRLLRRGVTNVDAALVYALGFLITAAQGLGIGLLTSIPLGGANYGNTQLASAQMHLMAMAMVGMALLGGLHAVWNTLTGRTFSEALARPVALLVVVGTQLAFVPLLIVGLQGVSYRANAYPPEFQVWQVLSTAGASVLLVGLGLALINLTVGRRPNGTRMAVALLAVGLTFSGALGCGPRVAAQPETVQLKITGMHCESCAETITHKLLRTGAVLTSDVHFSNTVQTVNYDGARTQVPQLVTVITNLGYAVELVATQP